MSKYKVEVNSGTNSVQLDDDQDHTPAQGSDEFSNKAVTIGVVVVGAALFEAALIPGIVLGAAAALAPKYMPKLEKNLHPLFNTTVRGIYKLGRKAQSAVGEVKEHMSDIAAEVKAEELSKAVETSQTLETETA